MKLNNAQTARKTDAELKTWGTSTGQNIKRHHGVPATDQSRYHQSQETAESVIQGAVNGHPDDQLVSLPSIASQLRDIQAGTPLARQVESVFNLMPCEMRNHPNAPRNPAEMVEKFLAPPVVLTTTETSPLAGVGKLMTVAEVSRLVGCSGKTIWSKVARGELQVFRTGRVVRITERSVANLITAGKGVKI